MGQLFLFIIVSQKFQAEYKMMAFQSTQVQIPTQVIFHDLCINQSLENFPKPTQQANKYILNYLFSKHRPVLYKQEISIARQNEVRICSFTQN